MSLHAAGVRFIVIGGAAATAHGSARLTRVRAELLDREAGRGAEARAGLPVAVVVLPGTGDTA